MSSSRYSAGSSRHAIWDICEKRLRKADLEIVVLSLTREALDLDR